MLACWSVGNARETYLGEHAAPDGGEHEVNLLLLLLLCQLLNLLLHLLDGVNVTALSQTRFKTYLGEHPVIVKDRARGIR